MFTGEIGHTYEFLAVAIDNVGQRQPRGTEAQTGMTLVPHPLQVSDVDLVVRSCRINKLVVSFNRPIAEDMTETLSNYRLIAAGPDRWLGT